MITVQVFDRPMCCSTGVCGPAVDPVLARFAADLEWLKFQGVAVQRLNLAQDAAAFVGTPEVRAVLARDGADCLPVVLVDGRIVSCGTYPARADLAAWAGLATPRSLPLDQGCCGGASSCC
jgi:hypothetical protein